MTWPGDLGLCAECGQKWPRGAEHALRSARWIGALGDLPRGVSPSNLDLVFHCRLRPERVLVFEIKRLNEPWQYGQLELLRWFDGLERGTVRVLRGTPDDFSVEQLTKPETRYRTTGKAFHASLHDFLNGQGWRDPARYSAPALELSGWNTGLNPYLDADRRRELELDRALEDIF